MKVKLIDWTAPASPNSDISYDHVSGATPLGLFTIIWKSWKDPITYCVQQEPYGYVDTFNCLDEAKKDAQRRFEQTVKACLV